MLVAPKLLKSAGCAVLQRRCFRVSNVIATPPQTRIPMIEKAAHGFTIAFGLLVTPAYILGHLKDYSGK